MSYNSLNTGIGWQASVAAAHAGRTLSWLVRPSSGLSARLVHGGVAFENAAGRIVWMFSAPTAVPVGSVTPLPTRLSLRKTAQGTVIELSVETSTGASAVVAAHPEFADFTASTSAAMVVPAAAKNPNPIVWSGQVVPGNILDLTKTVQTGDCYVDSGSPNTSFCLGNTNYVGPDDNTLLNFDVTDNLPSHVQITEAWATMTISSQANDTVENVGVWQAAQPWTNLATWNTYDGSDDWNTPGGDVTGAMLDEQGMGEASRSEPMSIGTSSTACRGG